MPAITYADRASLHDTTDPDIVEALAALAARGVAVPIVEEYHLVSARRTWWRTPQPVTRYSVLWEIGRGAYQIMGFCLEEEEKTDYVGHYVRKGVVLAYLYGLYSGVGLAKPPTAA